MGARARPLLRRARGLTTWHVVVDPAELQAELAEQARAAAAAALVAIQNVRENVQFLGQAWLGAVGVAGGLYGRPPEQGDEEDEPMGVDDFAPISATLPSAQKVLVPPTRNGFVELGVANHTPVEGDLSDAPTIVMRL